VIREHSQFELRRKLLAKGFESQQVDDTLDDCVKQDVQSDARFAECYIRSRAERGFGPARIRLELQQRGVAEADIAQAFAITEENWLQRARQVWQKKYAGASPQTFVERATQLRFLHYRGFADIDLQDIITSPPL